MPRRQTPEDFGLKRMKATSVFASSEMSQRWFWGLAPRHSTRGERQGANRAHTGRESFKTCDAANLPGPNGKEGLGDHAGPSGARTARTGRIQGSAAWLVLLAARDTCSRVFEATKPAPREVAAEGIQEDGAV